MRKINRDNFPPTHLYEIGTNRGLPRWRVCENNIIKAYKSDFLPFNDGTYIYPTNPSYTIWKNELKDVQGKKCCFCEKPIQNGVLEHYRPKKGWQQSTGDPMTKPGYYWLAYRWRNLLLACTECNESGQKGNLFPIVGLRAANPSANLTIECPVIINPYEEDPSTFLTFVKSEPASKHVRGLKTIEILKLNNRADLKEIRKDKYDLYNEAIEIVKLEYTGLISIDRLIELKERIRIKIRSKEPFSGMILENIKNGILVL